MRTRLVPVVLVVLAIACGRSTPPPAESPAAATAPTFNKDVAPILYEHCAPCHRPGQGTPFSLLEYQQARSRADKIAHATRTRHMPPWLPDRVEPGFIGERRLDPDQIETIARWAATGTPEGTAGDRPKAPVFAEGWQLGQPDLVIAPARPYVLRPQKEDVFRNVVISVPVPADRFVRAVEFSPGAAPVHHAVVHLDRTAASRRRDGGDGQPGFDGMGAPGAQEPEGSFVGWAPGRGPIVSPDGMPWRLERGTDIVLELHLLPGKTPVSVQPRLALFFADRPAAQTPFMVRMGSKAIDIPAGQSDYAITDTFVLPVDVDLLSIYPHAHFLGKQMTVVALRPDGTSKTLLQIRRWSFHWQQDYRYVTPIPLPRGTTISMRFTYDNSSGNEDNPHQPPVNVTAGQRSSDEMGNLLLQVLPKSAADQAALSRAFMAHDALANVAGAEMLIRHNPDNAENQTFLGSSYVDVGRAAQALPHFEYALRLDPGSAKTHNEMGGALLKLGRVEEAVARFRQAVALSPRDDRMRYNLGRALSAAGRAAEAAALFEQAIQINPDLAEAHDELGVLLFARGRLTEAVLHLRRAADLAPGSAIFHSDLGGALAEAGMKDEALRHVLRAL